MENFRKIGTRIFSALISRDFGELPTENERFRLHLPRWPWWNDGEQMANNQHYGHQDGRPWETPSLVIWKPGDRRSSVHGTEIQKDMNEAIHIGQFPMLLWEKVESYWIILNHFESFELSQLYWISHWTSHWMFWISYSFCPQFDRLGGL